MKSRYKIFDNDDRPYFLTFNVLKNIPVFTNSSYMDIIIENFLFYQQNQNMKIYSYVIMDNHIHLIASHINNLTDIVRNYKSYTAKKILKVLKSDKRGWILSLLQQFKASYKTESKYQFWEEGKHPKQIQNIEIFNQKTEYIHFNPVRRGLVENEIDWLYSSARNYHDESSVFKIDVLE
jgi:REP-associated tyrosine transposase